MKNSTLTSSLHLHSAASSVLHCYPIRHFWVCLVYCLLLFSANVAFAKTNFFSLFCCWLCCHLEWPVSEEMFRLLLNFWLQHLSRCGRCWMCVRKSIWDHSQQIVQVRRRTGSFCEKPYMLGPLYLYSPENLFMVVDRCGQWIDVCTRTSR